MQEDAGRPREMRERRRTFLTRFREEAEAAFLDGYRAAARAAQTPWMTPDQEKPLLDLFTLEKVAYEVRYEAANRPKWLAIPLAGLTRFADQAMEAVR
jgi:maltose alpha-D-glucosyltransferase/alpha-amylase